VTARPHWRVVIPLGIVIGVVATLVLWAFTGDDGGSEPTSTHALGPRLERGAPIDPDALWLFGFDSVRVDPVQLDEPRALGTSVFGAASARGADVFFYEPSTAQVGRLDARTSRFTVAEPVAAWAAPRAAGTIAATDTDLWIVTGPGAVARLDPKTLQVREARHLGATEATRTWVAASGRDAVALSVTPSGALLQPLADPAAAPVPFPVRDSSAGGTVRAVVRAGTVTWLVRDTGATVVPDAGPASVATLPDGAGPVHAATATGDSLWVLADDGATAYRLEAGRGTPSATVRLLRSTPSEFRAPVDLVAGAGAVYALLPTRREPDRHDGIVVRIDSASAQVTRSLTLPSSFFAGALAVTQ
jgi:hypothetical protein